jgi:hypothetical protein
MWKFAAATLAEICLLSAQAAALDTVVVVGENCPANTVRVTFAEATANQTELCGKLGDWYTARLAGGGSIDGHAQGCRLHQQDTRPLGHSLCKTDATTIVLIKGCAQPGVESACVTMNSGGNAYEISGAGPTPPAWDRWIELSGRRTSGARICGGMALAEMTWRYLQTPEIVGKCPSRPPNPLRDPGPPYHRPDDGFPP